MKRLTLKQARRNAGFTQEDLEAVSGIPQATISAIESGRIKTPGDQIVHRLSIALDIDARRLRFGIKLPKEAAVA